MFKPLALLTHQWHLQNISSLRVKGISVFTVCVVIVNHTLLFSEIQAMGTTLRVSKEWEEGRN
jgi:hypothetical protein